MAEQPQQEGFPPRQQHYSMMMGEPVPTNPAFYAPSTAPAQSPSRLLATQDEFQFVPSSGVPGKE